MKATSPLVFEKNLTCLARAAVTTLLLGMAQNLAILATAPANAQTYTVIHAFSGGGDGAYPQAGLTMDASGNFYGTTAGGFNVGNGNVFRLKRSGSSWLLVPLYSFAANNDGTEPYGRVTVATDGTLYGTTYATGDGGCCGTVFHLKPLPAAPKSALAPWAETILYRFAGPPNDGREPQGDLTVDSSGNIYGTTVYGGGADAGTIYELTPSGGGWSETVLYSAHNDSTGGNPWGGVVFDKSGNLFGVFNTTGLGGAGAVYKLSPSGSSWTEQVVHAFQFSDGENPQGGLILNPSGNLYGTTTLFGPGGGGTVFELMPANDGFTFSTLYGLGSPGGGPMEKLTMDAAGNLYGTTYAGGNYFYGSVFKLTPSSGGWTYTSLHDFCKGGLPCSDGAHPISGIVIDANGNLYGTTSRGGSNGCFGYGCGVVFEITP